MVTRDRGVEGEATGWKQSEGTNIQLEDKYQGCDVQQDKHNEHCCILYMKVAKTVNPKSSHHKGKHFSISIFFKFFLLQSFFFFF